MTNDELTALVKKSLYDVAPDLDGEEIAPDETFADQFEIDSMDFLNFIIALHKATGVDIPEADYPKLATLSGATVYLQSRIASANEPPSPLIDEGQHITPYAC